MLLLLQVKVTKITGFEGDKTIHFDDREQARKNICRSVI